MILLYYNCIVIISMYMWVVVKIRVPFWVLRYNTAPIV